MVEIGEQGTGSGEQRLKSGRGASDALAVPALAVDRNPVIYMQPPREQFDDCAQHGAINFNDNTRIFVGQRV